MATRYAVETVFKLIDQFTNPLGKADKQGAAVANVLKSEFAAAERSIARIGPAMLDMAKKAALAGVALVGVGIGVATKQYIDFDNAITAAGAKFQDLDVTSADYQEHLTALGAEARRVAAITQFNAVDTAGALDKMAMAGLTSSQSMKLLAGTADLATATGIDLTSAVDMATDALGAFNLTKDEFGRPLNEDGLAASLQRISDVVAKTTNMANTDMTMWFEAVKMGAPTFTSLGGTIEDFSAMVGVLANSGIKGGEAGTALRNMMLNLSAPTDKASMALEGLGVSVYDAAGNMLPIFDILKQFETAFGGDGMKMVKEYNAALKKAGGDASKVNVGDYITDMNMGTKIQSLETIFGKRTIGDVLVLLNEGTDKIAEFSNTLLNSGGAAADMANAMRQSLLVQIQILQSALTELGFKFVSAFADQGIDIVQRLTDAVNNFDVTPVVKAVQFAANAIMNVVSAVWQMRGAIAVIIGVWAAWKAIVYGAVIAMKAYEAINFVVTLATQGTAAAQMLLNTSTATGKTLTLLLAGAQKVAVAATWLFNAAQTALNFLFVASPIGWIVLAIGALVGIVVLLIKHWKDIIPAISAAWERIKSFFAGAITGIAEFFSGIFASIGAFFAGVWEHISGFFSTVWEGITNLFSTIVSAVAGFYAKLFDGLLTFLFGEDAPLVKQFLIDTFNSIIDWAANTIASIGDFFSNLWASISGFFSTVWEGLVSWFTNMAIKQFEFLTGIFTAIGGRFSSVWETVSGFFAGVWDSVVSWFTNMAIKQAEFFSGIFASIGAFFTGVWEHISGFFSTIWEGITGFFDMVWQGVLGIVEKIRIAVQPLMDFITGIFGGIMTAWQNLTAAFAEHGFLGALRQIGGAILSFILAPVEKVMSGLTWIPGIGGKIAEWQNSLASFRAELTGGDTTTAAPITARDAQSIQTERYINETTSNSNVTIGLERGLTAQVSGAAPNVRVNQYHSGAF